MRPFSVACAPGIGTGACLWAVSTVVEGPARWGLWTAALVLEAASRLVVRGVIAAMPVHELHLPERLAMLTLLSFVVLSAEALGQDVGVVRTAAWAVVAFALWWGYSEFTDGTAAAARTSRRVVFNYAHAPLLLLALVVAAAAGHVLVTGDGPAPLARSVLALAAALWLAALVLLVAVVPERRPGVLPQVRAGAARVAAVLAVVEEGGAGWATALATTTLVPLLAGTLAAGRTPAPNG